MPVHEVETTYESHVDKIGAQNKPEVLVFYNKLGYIW